MRMALIQEKEDVLRLAGPGSYFQLGGCLFFLLCALGALVSLCWVGLGALPWSLFSALAACVVMEYFDSSYLLHPLRREIWQEYSLLKAFRWSKKVADFDDIRGWATEAAGRWSH